MTLGDCYDELVQWSREVNVSFTSRSKLVKLLEQFETALIASKQEVDLTSVDACLKKVAQVLNIHKGVYKTWHIPTLLDLRFSADNMASLYGISPTTAYAGIKAVKQGSVKSPTGPQQGLDTDVEKARIEAMSEEDFRKELLLGMRIKLLEGLQSKSPATLQLAMNILNNERDRQRQELSKMWALTKDFLAWITGTFIPAAVRKFSTVKPPFDAKVLVAEVLDDEYTKLLRQYREIKPQVSEPLDEIVKKAKRRGKWKENRVRENKEERREKLASSSASNENAESALPSVSTLPSMSESNVDTH